MSEKHIVALEPVVPPDFSSFVQALQEAFSVTPREKFGNPDLVPSEDDIRASFQADGAQTFHLVIDGERAGGAVVMIDEKTRRNSLDLFFISPRYQNRGTGLAAWKTIEARYPDTAVWETFTPCFEERNIHFYVNKCGFHIVEFFNHHQTDPERPPGASVSPLDTFFRFEKVMK